MKTCFKGSFLGPHWSGSHRAVPDTNLAPRDRTTQGGSSASSHTLGRPIVPHTIIIVRCHLTQIRVDLGVVRVTSGSGQDRVRIG